MASDDTVKYCVCRQPYDEGLFMIECDVCKDWFHGSCVGILEHQAPDIEIFHCPNCQIIHGPLTLKRRRNWHRHDYSELDDGLGKAVQTGTVLFVQELKNRTFPSADEIPVWRPHGSEVTKSFTEANGFDTPILVDRPDGLGLRVPPPTFTILDVENYVGSMREIDVIDVARQWDYKMLMREWTEYYNSPNRTKIFNVISLEFSKTKLADLVEPPALVRQLSWVSVLWPDSVPDEVTIEKPMVQRYCLMGVKDSFTDFHVDFGGTSVWYHVLKGEKVFYLIRPTKANLTLYENWVSSANQSETFFGDQVDNCYRLVVKQGMTIFIPSGWIHAVLTPIDSLVFGGNFMHDYAIEMQIHVFEMEKRVKTPEKYLFPNFETVNWYAANHVLEYLNECSNNNIDPKEMYVTGGKALAASLKTWTHKKDYIKRDSIPDSIQYGKLLKELNKFVKLAMQKIVAKAKAEEKGKRKKKKDATAKSIETLEALQAETQKKIAAVTAESTAKATSKAQGKKKGNAKTQKDKAKGSAAPRLKLKIQKASAALDTSVYDFNDDEGDQTNLASKAPAGLKTPPGRGLKSSPLGMRLSPQAKLKQQESPVKLETKSSPGSVGGSPVKLLKSGDGPLTGAELAATVAGLKASAGLKLKVHNGKIISGETPHMGSPGKFQLLGAPKAEPGVDEDSDDEGPGLVVDENPEKPRKRPKASPKAPSELAGGGNTSGTTLKPGSLKLKLTFNKLQETKTAGSEATPGGPSVPGSAAVPPGLGGSGLASLAVGAVAGHLARPVNATSSIDVAKIIGMGLTSPGLAVTDNQTQAAEGLTQLKEPLSAETLSQLAEGVEIDDDSDPLADRINMPTIRGGLNGSIADILEASGYGTETDFKIDDDIGRAASPTMRDAIQGMLTMSRMTGPSPLTMGGASPFINTKPKAAIRLQRERGRKRKYTYDDDTGDRMPTCFKDEQYVYPTLDLSDNEDAHVFKPRGRPKKDETWNPKAKLAPNAPKPDRPQREGTRRESVESGLAAAAAKLATQPPPKRQYIRKKAKTPKPESSLAPVSPQAGTSGFGLPEGGLSYLGSPVGEPTTPQTPLSPVKPGSSSSKVLSKKLPKKGMATAKQRLGKILKINKMWR